MCVAFFMMFKLGSSRDLIRRVVILFNKKTCLGKVLSKQRVNRKNFVNDFGRFVIEVFV